MSKTSIRYMIIVLTLFTALVHGVLLQMNGFQLLFALNALGYLVLLFALLRGIPAGQDALVHYVFMGYTLVTIIAWVAINGDFGDPLGVSNKIGEALLVVFLYMHLQRS